MKTLVTDARRAGICSRGIRTRVNRHHPESGSVGEIESESESESESECESESGSGSECVSESGSE